MQDLVRYPIDWRRRRSASCIVFSAKPFRFQNILAHFLMSAVRPGVTLTIDIAVLHTFAPAAPQVGPRVTASAAQARLASFHLMILFASSASIRASYKVQIASSSFGIRSATKQVRGTAPEYLSSDTNTQQQLLLPLVPARVQIRIYLSI